MCAVQRQPPVRMSKSRRAPSWLPVATPKPPRGSAARAETAAPWPSSVSVACPVDAQKTCARPSACPATARSSAGWHAMAVAAPADLAPAAGAVATERRTHPRSTSKTAHIEDMKPASSSAPDRGNQARAVGTSRPRVSPTDSPGGGGAGRARTRSSGEGSSSPGAPASAAAAASRQRRTVPSAEALASRPVLGRLQRAQTASS
mmetsp:Transcript_81588/g.251847  ORF Transcript_81588/g.251847 Transcript_81588/m.251847 type:complete len:204 (-) Transcript_81588:855-1466(-)